MISHWMVYKALLKDDDNILAAAERVVATPANFPENSFSVLVASVVRWFAQYGSEARHPCSGGIVPVNGVDMLLDSANNCAPPGCINFYPYAARP